MEPLAAPPAADRADVEVPGVAPKHASASSAPAPAAGLDESALDHRLEGKGALEAVTYLLGIPNYWILLFCVVFSTAANGAATYLSAFVQRALRSSPKDGSRFGMASPVGAMIGTLISGSLYDHMSPRSRAIFGLCAAAVNVTLRILISVFYGAGVLNYTMLVGLYGGAEAASAIIVNVFVNIYLADLGGKSHAATANNIPHLLGVAAEVGFQAAAGRLLTSASYLGFLWLVVALEVLSMVLIAVFIVRSFYDGTAQKGPPS